MIHRILFLAGLVGICEIGFGQRFSRQDSLIRELKRTALAVDSMRKDADNQFKVLESMEKMVDVLSHSKDSATNGLAGWRRNHEAWSSKFDSTLERLDSAVGVLNKLNALADPSLKPKK